MPSVPIKPEYGPTLGRLLEPSWRAAAPATRRLAIAGAAVVAAVLAGVVLTLLDSTYSHGRPVPFSFSYRGLYRSHPEPGQYVRIVKRHSSGALADSLAVAPLTLPPYSGDPLTELAVYADSYIAAVSRRYQDFVLRGEGKTTVNNVLAYDVGYTTTVEGREMYGRDVLLVGERPGAREGVDIVMRMAPGDNKQVLAPLEVASTGILRRPLRSFTLG